MDFYTYLYIDPTRHSPWFNEGEPFYVGKGIGARDRAHLGRTDRHPVTNRIKNIRRKGAEPLILRIAEGLCSDGACFIEICTIAWIGRKDLHLGPLCNLTDGGEGSQNPNEETKQKLREAVWNASPETYEKWKQGSLRLHQDPVKRQNYLDGRSKTFTETWRQNNRAAQLNRFKDPEKKAHFLAATAKNPEWLEKQRKAFNLECSVDGVTWYESRKALAAALGWGKNGTNHPGFRYKDGKVGTKPRKPNTKQRKPNGTKS